MSVRRSTRSRRFVTIGAVVALVVADVVLVGALWRAQHAVPESGRVLSAPDGDVPSRSAQSTSPSSSPSASASASSAFDRQLLAVVDATRIVRGSSSRSCSASDAPTLETTDDGGQTWTPVTLPAEVALVRVQRLASTSSGLLLVGSDASCRLHLFSGAPDGSSWTLHDEDLPDAWYITPEGGVNAPGGRVTQPCEQPVSLTARGTGEAAVICDDDSVHSTTDGGGSWTPVHAEVDQQAGDALVLVSDGYVVADRDAACPDVRVRAFIGDDSTPVQSCVPGTMPVALASQGDAVWLSSDSDLQKSGDRGKTW